MCEMHKHTTNKVAQTDKISQTNKRNRMALTDERNGSDQQLN